ncbi:MAG: glycosyltransferase family 4 protein [Candidatus Micrarchaeota archaeon]
MKICMLDPLFYPYFGGAEKNVYEVSKRLAKKGHEIVVLTSQLPNTKREEELDGIKIKRSASVYLEKLPSFMPPPFTVAPFFVNDLRKEEADVFHIHNRFWYYAGALLALKLKKAKTALTLHNAKPEGISFMTDKSAALYDGVWGHRIMENMNGIIAVSEYTKRVTVPPQAQEKTVVIHNGVDVERFTPKKSGESVRAKLGVKDEFVVMTNARLVEQKGLKYLIDAFAAFRKEKGFEHAKLLFVGKGPLKEKLIVHCESLGIKNEKDVFFRSGIPEEELPLYYRAADVFVLPSLWEPCAVVLFEALASGLPIITTAVGGTPEIMTRESGMLVNAHSAEEIFDELKRFAFNAELRAQFGKGARERAVNAFTWEITAEKVEKFYESLLNPRE